MNSVECRYGVGDCSYIAAGEISGLIKLVDSFYGFMDTLSEAKDIRSMHRDDLTSSKKKLAYFLSGWLGGPKLYSENFGSISIPSAHKHLAIGVERSEAWILCMQKAVSE
jgi:hemoglobin